ALEKLEQHESRSTTATAAPSASQGTPKGREAGTQPRSHVSGGRQERTASKTRRHGSKHSNPASRPGRSRAPVATRIKAAPSGKSAGRSSARRGSAKPGAAQAPSKPRSRRSEVQAEPSRRPSSSAEAAP